MDSSKSPQTLLEAVQLFSDPDRALAFMVSLRWPDGKVSCPNCGSARVTFMKARRLWTCKEGHARRQFSVKVGTVMEDSPIGLDKWLPAFWLIANCKNGISSYELARNLNVTQKTAWFMLHRIRLAMQTGTFRKMSSEVEADETFIGGRARFMHGDRKARTIRGTGGSGKAVVMGLLRRHGRDGHSTVRVKAVDNVRKGTLHEEIRQNVKPGSALYTDELRSYDGLEPEYVHSLINHAKCYVKGNVHTQGVDNLWSLLKRALKGTYVSVQPFHLFRYLDEQAFQFNKRAGIDGKRFVQVIRNIVGRRLTYQNLIGAGMVPTTT